MRAILLSKHKKKLKKNMLDNLKIICDTQPLNSNGPFKI